MNIIKKIMLTTFLIVGAITVFAGCSDRGTVQLGTPVATVITNNGRLMLMTTDNPRADSYTFGWYTGPQPTNLAGYSVHTSTNHFLDVTNYVSQSAIYHFYIQAVGNETRYLTSNRSAVITYDNTNTLISPTLEIINTTLSWTASSNATGYRLYKNNIIVKTFTSVEARTYNISGQITSPIIYNFEVIALGGTSGGATYKDSLKSNIISYVEHLKLAVPQNVRVLTDENTQEKYITWDNVTNASGYSIRIDSAESPIIVSNNQYILSSTLTQAKRYNFEVKSNATGVLIESQYSPVYYFDNFLTLDTPVVQGASRNGEDVIVVWEPVLNAESYTLIVNGEVLADEHSNPLVLYNTQVSIDGALEKEEGGFDFEIYANAYDFYLQSETSEMFSYSGIDLLVEPENINIIFNTEQNVVTLSWDEVQGASYYYVAVDNEVFSTEELSVDIEDLLQEGQIVQIRLQARGNGFTEPSQFSDAILFNYVDSQEQSYETYANKFFYHYDYHDYYIESQEEMNTYVAYLISNQIEESDTLNRNIAYIDYDLADEQEEKTANGYIILLLENTQITLLSTSVINVPAGEEIIITTSTDPEVFELLWNGGTYQITQEVKDGILALEDEDKIHIKYGKVTPLGALDGTITLQEIVNYKQYLALTAYTETHQLSYYPPSLAGVANAYTFRFIFNYDMIPTLISTQENYVQSDDLLPYESSIGRSENYNSFVSELSLIEIEVETSEQLFMVVSSGAKPIFITENSQAEEVYEAAKSVLRQIIDDTMTDYQKTLAIFDYVSYNTVYDHYVYNLALQQPAPSNLLEYKVFYLEGVILDGKAVCDGIAKTVALLLNMEGIEAVKINGDANGGGGLVGHAWNKVYLEIDGVYNWYVIDATWSDVPSGSNKEYLSRRYFLLNDADIATTHFAESTFNPVADTEFNYYYYTEYQVGYNFYIENQTELNHLVSYLLDNYVEGVEIKLAVGFTPNVDQAIFLAGEHGSVDDLTFTYENNTMCLIDFIYS